MDEIEHEGKIYILKSSSIPKMQAEQMIKDRVSKVASKVQELEKIAQERLDTIESLQGNQNRYDVLSKQFGELQSKLEASEGRFEKYQSISKFGITDPDLIEAIEWQYNKSNKDVDKEQLKSLGEWLESYIDNPQEAPITIRPHLQTLKESSSSIKQPAATEEQTPQEKQISKVEAYKTDLQGVTEERQPIGKQLVSTNKGAVRTPEGEDVWKRAVGNQNWYNDNFEKVQDAWMKRYGKGK